MNFLEKDLETIIFEADNRLLIDKGLFISGHKIRQLRIGNYGIADIVTFRKNGYYDEITGKYNPFLHIHIFELKKDDLDIYSFLQALSYCKGLDRWFQLYKPKLNVRLSITLVGKQIKDNSSFTYLFDYLNDDISLNNYSLALNVYTYSYELNGLSFESHNRYYLIDEGF